MANRIPSLQILFAPYQFSFPLTYSLFALQILFPLTNSLFPLQILFSPIQKSLFPLTNSLSPLQILYSSNKFSFPEQISPFPLQILSSPYKFSFLPINFSSLSPHTNSTFPTHSLFAINSPFLYIFFSPSTEHAFKRSWTRRNIDATTNSYRKVCARRRSQSTTFCSGANSTSSTTSSKATRSRMTISSGSTADTEEGEENSPQGRGVEAVQAV